MSALKRVGHKGADRIAPGNTAASFDAALEAGVDMIEFDVLPSRDDGRLLLAHDYSHSEHRSALTLEAGLEHLASGPFSSIELDVDLKLPGYELEVVAALRSFGLLDRALISSQYRESLALLRAARARAAPGLVGAQAAPGPVPQPADVDSGLGGGAWPGGGSCPAGRPGASARGECDALMAHWRLVTPRLVRAVHRAGGELYVWTVDELPRDPRAPVARSDRRDQQRPAPVRPGGAARLADRALPGAVARRTAEVHSPVPSGGAEGDLPEQPS